MRKIRVLTALWAGAAVALASCAQPSPDAAPRTVATRSVAEQRQGDQSHTRIVAQYGGAYTQGRAAAYVRDIGMRLAAKTEQPQGPWTFTVLDSPVVNAFALPGGYVYVTRGLMALANDEAELAGVIGHEIGHVTAAHSVRRQETAAVAQIGVLAAVIGAAVLGADRSVVDAVGQLGAQGAQGAVASYSRAQELEADRLGIGYLARAGYDPLAQADFLSSLQAQSALSSQLAGGGYDANRVDFFSTHPATAERVRAAATAAAREAAADAPRNRDAYLRAIDGMTYGDSAAQGFVRDGGFVHPDLRFAFSAPRGFEITNAAAAVTMRGPRGAGVVFDGGRDPGGALDAYVARVWAGGIAKQARTGQLQNLQTGRINGLEAASAVLPAQMRDGVRLLHLTAIRTRDGRLYRFMGVVGTNDRAGLAAVAQAGESFRALSAAQAAREKPWRLRVVTVRRGDTVQSLASQMPFESANAARFRVLNALGPNDAVRAGDRVKLVAR